VPVYPGNSILGADSPELTSVVIPPKLLGTLKLRGATFRHFFLRTTQEPPTKKRDFAVHGKFSQCPGARGKSFSTESLAVSFAGWISAELFPVDADGIGRRGCVCRRQRNRRTNRSTSREKLFVAQPNRQRYFGPASRPLNDAGWWYLSLQSAAHHGCRRASCTFAIGTQMPARNVRCRCTFSDERRAGLHPADTQERRLLRALDLNSNGRVTSLFVIEHASA